MHNLKALHAFICSCLLLLIMYVNTQFWEKMKENKWKDRGIHPQIYTKITCVTTSWRFQTHNQSLQVQTLEGSMVFFPICFCVCQKNQHRMGIKVSKKAFHFNSIRITLQELNCDHLRD